MKVLILVIFSFFIFNFNNLPQENSPPTMVNKEVAAVEDRYAKKAKNKRDAYYFLIMGTVIYIALGIKKERKK